MKAITVRQPWASLIAEGVKTIETRPKQHPWRSAIGQTIAIHAAKREPSVDLRPLDITYGPMTMKYGSTCWYLHHDDGRVEKLPLGAVVATCTLADVLPMVETRGYDRSLIVGEHLTIVEDAYPGPDGEAEQNGWTADEQRPFGDFAPGCWALLLDNVRKTAPAPCRGAQGLWTVPADVADNLLGWTA